MPKQSKLTPLEGVTASEARQLTKFLSLHLLPLRGTIEGVAGLEGQYRIEPGAVSFQLPKLSRGKRIGRNLVPIVNGFREEIAKASGKSALGLSSLNDLHDIVERNYGRMKLQEGQGLLTLRHVKDLGSWFFDELLLCGTLSQPSRWTYVSLDQPLWLERDEGDHRIVRTLEPFMPRDDDVIRIVEPFTVLGFGPAEDVFNRSSNESLI